jgi:radical SAM superfamily enzyme
MFPPLCFSAAEKHDGKQLSDVLSEDEYIDILKACVRVIPDHVVIHRLTGDGDKKLLAAPLWSGDKKHVWNRIRNDMIKGVFP